MDYIAFFQSIDAPMLRKPPAFASSWPLPPDGVRFEIPRFLVKLLAEHPLTRDLYPLATGYYPLAQGHTVARERHESHLVIYCVAGRGELSIAGGSWGIQAGELICLPKGTAHTYRADDGDPWSIYWVHFDGTRALDYLAFIGAEQAVVQLGIHPVLATGFTGLFTLRTGGYSERVFIHGAARLKELLTGLGWLASRSGTGAGLRINLDRVEQLMRRRISATLSLDELAEEAGVSRYHFVRRFRAQTGQSPIQYFIHLKMQHACQVLDSDERPIKQVAMALGYEDAYYFSRLFKKVMGVSPQQYRNNRST